MTPSLLLAVALLSPKDQATPTNAPMAKVDAMIPPDVAVDTNPPAPSTLSLAWNPSPAATGYSLQQWPWSGGGSNIWNTPLTNVTITFQWGDEPYRFKYGVYATNSVGWSVMSSVLVWPSLPSTKVILNWQGSQKIQQSTDCKTWSLLTNGSGPVTLPIRGAQRFFMGTNVTILGAP